jgi:hypothetical protein
MRRLYYVSAQVSFPKQTNKQILMGTNKSNINMVLVPEALNSEAAT